MDKSKIAILTTVVNFELYQKSAPMFPKGIQKYVIDGRNGMHGIHSIYYLFEKLKGHGIEWLIMADEDVIFYQPNAVFTLLEIMERQQNTVCGVRDGGVIAHRNYNPYVINTFFSILHFQKIEKIFDKGTIQKNQYCRENEFEDDLSALKYDLEPPSTFEFYYCFYLWLRRQGHTFLFLESETEHDGIANSIFVQGEKMLTHTWYARSYGVNEIQTRRIDTFFKDIPSKEFEPLDSPIVFKKSTFALQERWRKLLVNIRYKINT